MKKTITNNCTTAFCLLHPLEDSDRKKWQNHKVDKAGIDNSQRKRPFLGKMYSLDHY